MKNKKTKLETLILFVEGWANENYYANQIKNGIEKYGKNV